MRVLVVEDEELIARSLRDGLASEGYSVDHAAAGDEGVWMAQEHDYDAIILDVLLPGMNGFLVCRTLREAGVTTPILMLTAKDGEHDVAEGLDTGADDYVVKPFSLVVLAARLRALIRRGPAERPATLEHGTLASTPPDAPAHVVTRTSNSPPGSSPCCTTSSTRPGGPSRNRS